MTKTTEKNVGFEVLTENEDGVTFKRVLSTKRPAKENRKIEMGLPKVTIHYFDKDDIERLNKIQIELAEKYVVKRENTFTISIKALKDFLMK
ncbi:MAG: hypothetical protein IPL56_20930 [Saprospiraceae bacterium]|nr:hypothetical protein [Saprospiraceae bacterium]